MGISQIEMIRQLFYIFLRSMLLRKSRKHLQGSSNRVNTDGTFHTPFNTSYSHTKKEVLNKPYPSSSTSYLKYRRPHRKENSFNHTHLHTHPQEDNSQQTEIECKLRKIYQGRKNIVRALDGWAFDSKGYISRQHFKQQLASKLGTEPTEEEVSSLLHKYAGNEETITAHQFISLIHKKTQGSMFNETLFPFQQQSKERNAKIDNLKQNLKVYSKAENNQIRFLEIDRFLFKINSSISKIRHQSNDHLLASKDQFFNQLFTDSQYEHSQKKILKNIQKVINYGQLRNNIQTHQSVDHLFIDPILRKTHNHAHCTQQQHQQSPIFLDKMYKKSVTSYKLLKNSQKKLEFDPSSMLNTNQQKTRFIKPTVNKENHNEMQFPVNMGVSPNQKDLIIETIKSQSNIHKQRYANKLEKIRQFQQNLRQNIQRKQQGAIQREQGRLRRMRHEQQAYNYVNFIKKRWE